MKMLTKEKTEVEEVTEISEKKKKSPYWKIWLTILSLTILLAIAGFFPKFCDWYANNIYRYLCDGLSRITDLLPFILGEIMMYLGIAMVIFSVIFLVLLVFLRKKPKYRRFCAGYFKTFLMMLTCVIFIYMPMWYIPFRGTVFGRGETNQRTEFTYDEIYALLEYATNGANSAAEEIEIGEDGKVIFPTAEELQPLISDSMINISDEFPRLKGFYPKVKTAYCSDILERMGIGGFTYPFTMEATHSKYLSPTYQPVLDAHELSHHKGYYKENEANFLSQIALSQSENPYLRLSAFLDMWSYIESEYSDARDVVLEQLINEGVINPPADDSMESLKAFVQEVKNHIKEMPKLSDKVRQIKDAGRIIEQEVYEADSHPIDEMPAVNEVIVETSEVGWETQGEVLQENTYDGVTLLLLQYFDGKLY